MGHWKKIKRKFKNMEINENGKNQNLLDITKAVLRGTL